MNVQAGDLAVCIKDPNMGCFVKVLTAAPEFSTPAWWCRTLQPCMGLSMRDDDDAPMRHYAAGHVMAFADAELRPIRGQHGANPDSVHQLIEEHAGA